MLKFYRISLSFSNNLANHDRTLTLGSFDGIHLGHKHLFQELIKTAKNKGQVSSVLSFYPHPSQRLGKIKSMPLITNLRQKISILQELGVDELILLNFSSKLTTLSWQKFCTLILHQKLKVKNFIIGEDARIGKDALGTPQVIPDFLNSLNISTKVIRLKTLSDQKFASRVVRAEVSEGNIEKANILLGRRFQLCGKVIKGNKLGREIGFPTANLNCRQTLIPPNGVYAVKARIDNLFLPAIVNIGNRPTIFNKFSIEVHILDFNQSIYGRYIFLDFYKKIREELKFPNIDALKEQIKIDCDIVKNYFNNLYTFKVTQRNRLDKVLVDFFKLTAYKISRSRIEKLIDSNQVFVNFSIKNKSNSICSPNDVIDIDLTSIKSDNHIEPQDIKLDILFEDSNLLVINKPSGLVVHPGAGNKSGTLLNGIKKHLHGQSLPPRLGLVHRLDKETSGALIFAKNEQVLADLQTQFAQRLVKKKYLALAYLPLRGRHIFRVQDQGIIESSIGRHPTIRTKMCIRSDGKIAKTSWQVIERFDGMVLLQIDLHTGRTHQIRVHLESVGSGILGDKLYLSPNCKLPLKIKSVLNHFSCHMLHAWKISFLHPKLQMHMNIECPLPKEFYLIFDAINYKFKY